MMATCSKVGTLHCWSSCWRWPLMWSCLRCQCSCSLAISIALETKLSWMTWLAVQVAIIFSYSSAEECSTWRIELVPTNFSVWYLSSILLQSVHLKHILCHLLPAPTISSAMYTVLPHFGHFAPPPKRDDILSRLALRSDNTSGHFSCLWLVAIL